MTIMKTFVITPIFTIAGVPLAQRRIAEALAKRGHNVVFVIGHVMLGHQTPKSESLEVVVLKKQRVRQMLFSLVLEIKSRNPDVIFTAEDHLNLIVVIAAKLAGSSAKITASSRVTPFDTYSNRWFSKRWWLKQFARVIMPHADVLSCVSADMVAQYHEAFGETKHVCVYNVVVDANSRQRSIEPVLHPWANSKAYPLIVAAGRLARWKGFDLLIDAAALLAKRVSFRLLILGDGPEREPLAQRIRDYSLEQVIELVGYVENPLKFFSRADVFVLSSRVEGLPNVLVEAMMCGATPVATDCATGPREVLRGGGRYGYLVPIEDPDALAQGMFEAIHSPIPYHLLQEAVEPFEEGRVLDRHFQLLGLSG
jgi:glycosyltransferase involved in cell wall biosynthesis